MTNREPRVLMAVLSVRTSAKGARYMTGWLGKGKLVAFPGKADKYGNETFDLYLSEPRQEVPQDGRSAGRGQEVDHCPGFGQ